MPSFRLTLAYDGTNFFGSQVQPHGRTVQGEVDRVLAALAGVHVRSVFAGRTDRGVHAAGQVAVVRDVPWRSSAEDLGRALNAELAVDVAAANVAACDDTFHPRFDACWREYRYRIAPAVIDPFLWRYAWTPRAPIDVGSMSAGARRLVGSHDFASFAGNGEGVPWSERAQSPRGATRTILRCECREIGFAGPGANATRVVEVRVVADGFLPRMVRNIVGALVEVGQGRQDSDWIDDVLAARDRRAGSVVAPARGLTLWRVGYHGDALEDL